MTGSSKDAKTRTLRAGEWLRPMNDIGLTSFLVDYFAIRETEYGRYGREGL